MDYLRFFDGRPDTYWISLDNNPPLFLLVILGLKLLHPAVVSPRLGSLIHRSAMTLDGAWIGSVTKANWFVLPLKFDLLWHVYFSINRSGTLRNTRL